MVSYEITAKIFAVVVCILLSFVCAFHVITTLMRGNKRTREKLERMAELMGLGDDEDEMD